MKIIIVIPIIIITLITIIITTTRKLRKTIIKNALKVNYFINKLNNLARFIIKLLKKHGISTNFIIKFREIYLEEKIGEGGYGEVFKGKWLG